MKKLINIIICFTVLLSVLNIEAVHGKTSEDYTEEIEVLEALGIIQDFDANMDMSANVTRGEFVNHIASLINEPLSATDEDDRFYYDVDQTHYAFSAIAAFTKRGILKGNGNRMFYPEDNITTADAYRIMLSVMEYGTYLERIEDEPMGCLVLAKKTGLSDDCVNGVYLTLGDMVRSFYNALFINLPEFSSISGETAVYEVNDEVTLLSLYYDAEYAQGRLNAAEQYYMSSDYSVDKTQVRINDLRLTNEYRDVTELLGRMVNFIFREDNGVYTLLWAGAKENENILEIFPKEGHIEFNADSFSLNYQNPNMTKERKAVMSQNIVLLLNGAPYVGDAAALLGGQNIRSVTLLDYEKDSRYDVAIVWSYENIVVSVAVENDLTIYGEDGKKCEFDENSLICDKSGAEVEFGSIDIGAVVSVFKSQNGDAITAYISSDRVSGAITAISDDVFGRTIFTVDNRNYNVNADVDTSEVKVGRNVTFVLDAFSYVEDIKISFPEYTIGYLVNVKQNRPFASAEMTFKIFTENNEMVILDSADRVTLDGTRYNDVSDISKKLCSGDSVKNQIIAFKTNSDGLINYIETAENTSDGILREYEAPISSKYATGLKRFISNPRILLSNDSKIFSVPNDDELTSADDTEFSMINITQFESEKVYNVYTYKFLEGEPYAQIVLIKGMPWVDITSSTNYILVERIINSVNEDKDVYELVKGYQRVSLVEIPVDEEFSLIDAGIKEGDIIRVGQNKFGEITRLENNAPLYTPGGKMKQIGEVGDGSFVRMGYVNEVTDSYVKIGFESGADFDEIFNLSGVTAVVFDENGEKHNKVYSGPVSAIPIIDYKTQGENCSRIVIHGGYGTIRAVYIYL